MNFENVDRFNIYRKITEYNLSSTSSTNNTKSDDVSLLIINNCIDKSKDVI